jgi:hypothetical protein
MCSWINDIYGLKCGRTFYEHWQQIFFWKKMNKNNMMEKNYLGLF